MTARTGRRSSAALKPDYDPTSAPKPMAADGMSHVERMAALVKRIHDAVLTLDATAGAGIGPAPVGNGWPDYVQEFSDRVGVLVRGEIPRRWTPTAAQVDDMLDALALLEGLRPEYFMVVLMKARGDFLGRASWSAIGSFFSRSDFWARSAYERAVIQAARRGGLIATAQENYAVVCASILVGDHMRTWIGGSANVKQTLYDLKAKNACGIVDAFAIWTRDRLIAKRLIDAAQGAYAARKIHASWFEVGPFDVEDALLTEASRIGAQWRIDYLI